MKNIVIAYISTQHRYFAIFLPKCYCFGSFHTEKLTMIHGNMSPTKMSVCQLLVADTLNLTQWDYSSTFIVSMPPKRCQPISMYVMWQIIGLRRSGLKQMDILNQFGDGQKDKCTRGQCPGSHGNTEQDQVQLSAWQGMGHQLHTRLSRFTVSRWLSAAGTAQKDGPQQTAQKASSTECQAQKGMCAIGPTT